MSTYFRTRHHFTPVLGGQFGRFFQNIAVKNDTIFTNSVFNVSNWPFKHSYMKYTPDNGKTWQDFFIDTSTYVDDGYRLHICGDRIYRIRVEIPNDITDYTVDFGATWTTISIPYYGIVLSEFLIYNSIPFVSEGEDQLLKLSELTSNGIPEDYSIWGLTFCENALFAYCDYVNKMFVSMDNAVTWTVTNSFTREQGKWGKFSFTSYGKILFISTGYGIHYTQDYGQSWYTLNDGLLNKNVSGIKIYKDTLFASTLGNEVWKHSITDIPLLSIKELKMNSNNLLIFPNPASNIINIKIEPIDNVYVISIHDLTEK